MVNKYIFESSQQRRIISKFTLIALDLLNKGILVQMQISRVSLMLWCGFVLAIGVDMGNLVSED